MSAGEPDAHALVAAARDVARVEDASTVGCWQRAAAMLGRQGMEAALHQLWQRRAPGMRRVNARCQLLCLGSVLRDEALAGRVHAAWDGLSRACHVRVYELPPTALELDSWLGCAWELCDAVTRNA